MTPSKLILCATAAALCIAGPATAAPPAGVAPAEMADIQAQLKALKAEYDAKIAGLEARLKAAEDRAAAAEAAAKPAQPVATAQASPPPSEAAPGEVIIADNSPAPDAAPAATSKAASPNAMNPGVSVVLNGNYVAASRDPETARIAGFPISDDAMKKPRGFSLDESEITLAANVDPYLTANLTISFDRDNQASVEEAYIQSTSLPAGLTVRGGRFFSAIGYLNERHAHNWTFIDMPLPYRALLGNQYGDDGVQVRWLAPLPLFVEFGAEAFRGDAFPAGNAQKNRSDAQTAFVHAGADINDSSSWLAGLSYIHAKAHDRVDQGDRFSGTQDLGIVSGVYKWAPGGNPTQKNLVLSGEYFFGRQKGLFDNVAASRDPSGWYAQGVYQFTQRWSAGVRYAELSGLDAPGGLAGTGFDSFGHTPRSVTGLLEYDTSEFGRFRLQYSHDMADLRPNDELLFQYTVVYGPHGAHRY